MFKLRAEKIRFDPKFVVKRFDAEGINLLVGFWFKLHDTGNGLLFNLFTKMRCFNNDLYPIQYDTADPDHQRYKKGT